MQSAIDQVQLVLLVTRIPGCLTWPHDGSKLLFELTSSDCMQAAICTIVVFNSVCLSNCGLTCRCLCGCSVIGNTRADCYCWGTRCGICYIWLHSATLQTCSGALQKHVWLALDYGDKTTRCWTHLLLADRSPSTD